jgi:uncharacterized membrane protein YdcZ (DUF606 family)
MFEINTIIGFFGMLLILIAFLMDQLHKWNSDDLIYDVINFVGSSLLVYYAIVLVSVPFFILNFIWAIFSLKDIIYDMKRDYKKKSRIASLR